VLGVPPAPIMAAVICEPSIGIAITYAAELQPAHAAWQEALVHAAIDETTDIVELPPLPIAPPGTPALDVSVARACVVPHVHVQRTSFGGICGSVREERVERTLSLLKCCPPCCVAKVRTTKPMPVRQVMGREEPEEGH
jgi:hypothetical protein